MVENRRNVKNMVFLGAPGVGKGTIAAVIANKFGIVHLSTGSIFREEIASKSELGKKVVEIVESGKYVPDEITNEIVRKKIIQILSENKKIILDGYPRTLNQAKFLDSIENFEYEVIELQAPNDLIMQRLSGRRFCPQCKASYHILFMPSKKNDLCEKCDTPLITRKDDSIESIKIRQKVYQEETAPLFDYYKDKALVFDASGNADSAANEIMQQIMKK